MIQLSWIRPFVLAGLCAVTAQAWANPAAAEKPYVPERGQMGKAVEEARFQREKERSAAVIAGRALRSGRRGRRFESSHPDQIFHSKARTSGSKQSRHCVSRH